MIFWQKTFKNYKFDKSKYNFVSIIQIYLIKIINVNGLTDNYKWDGKDTLGSDSHTKFHKQFYKKIDKSWIQLEKCIKILLKNFTTFFRT